MHISGKRVKIERFLNIKEIEAYLEVYNNLEYRSIHDHTDLSDGQRLKEMFESNTLNSSTNSLFKIMNHQDEMVGIISFSKIEDYDYVIGYRILKPAFKRKGYMSEALKMFVIYMFETLPKLRRCTLKISSENIESIGLAKKIGFKHEGTLREAYEYRNHVCDFEIYGLLRKEKPST